jgi:hypothetical protein
MVKEGMAVGAHPKAARCEEGGGDLRAWGSSAASCWEERIRATCWIPFRCNPSEPLAFNGAAALTPWFSCGARYEL